MVVYISRNPEVYKVYNRPMGEGGVLVVRMNGKADGGGSVRADTCSPSAGASAKCAHTDICAHVSERNCPERKKRRNSARFKS